MFSQADIKVISTVFGKTPDEISGALSSTEEVSLDLRLNGKVLTDEQQKELRESAVKQGKEIGYKEIAKGLELELESGEKDPVKIAEKFKTTISSVLEEKYKNPNPTDEQIALAKKAAEWEGKYKTLFDTFKSKETEVNEWKSKYDQKEQAIKNEALNNKILSSLPKDIAMDKGDALLIIRNSLAFEESDGKLIVKKGDKVYNDPVGEPEPLENVVKLFTEEKGWIKRDGGMGGKDRNGLPPTKKGLTPDQAYKYLQEKGIAPASQEGLNLFNELTSK